MLQSKDVFLHRYHLLTNFWEKENIILPVFSHLTVNAFKLQSGAHQMELPSPLISWVNPFPSRVINRTIFFCNALESNECACCLLSFLYFHWLFPLSARETSSGNRSIYKSTRARVGSKGLCGRWRLPLMGSCCSRVCIINKVKQLRTQFKLFY